eukprot:COSAG02_NODE_558_length_20348_cov_6.479431_5_plen_79_part_00
MRHVRTQWGTGATQGILTVKLHGWEMVLILRRSHKCRTILSTHLQTRCPLFYSFYHTLAVDLLIATIVYRRCHDMRAF